jgi:hypothetical protein
VVRRSGADAENYRDCTDCRPRPMHGGRRHLDCSVCLDMWTVEKRPNGWYFSKSAYHGDKHEWRGPYASEMSVTLMIARELRKEIKKRHKL